MTDSSSLEIISMRATDLRDELQRGSISATEVTLAYIEQLEAVNPEVNAVVAANPEQALDTARELDRLRPDGRGPLHGLVMGVKDVYHVQGLPTSYGHRAFANGIANRDSLHVARVKHAGAVILGKTNIPELALGGHSQNDVYGRTVNPWKLERSAGGSSGGSAAALSSGLLSLADGSDMGGSLRIPAGFCGVVGLRPTTGAVPRGDADNMFDPLVTAGPMGRCVDDAALLLSVMAQPSPRDVRSYSVDPAIAPLSRGLVPRGTLAGLRVAVTEDLAGAVPVDSEIRSAFRNVVQLLSSAGAHVEEAVPYIEKSHDLFFTCRAVGMQVAFAKMLAETPEYFTDFVAENIRDGERISAAQLYQAEIDLTATTRKASEFFSKYDLLIAPTTVIPAFDANEPWPRTVEGVEFEHYMDWAKITWAFTPMGVPAISLPAGQTHDGLPIGVQIMAGARRDAFLLGIAATLEEILGQPMLAPIAGVRKRESLQQAIQATF